MVFHDIGWNTLHSFTYNYGLNFIGAGAGTWLFIGSGLDWKWNRLAYDNEWLAKSGLPALYIGFAVPGITPLAFYITGTYLKDEKLQVTGLALVQTLMLTMGIQSVFKISTGRAMPGIITEFDHKRSSRTDDFSDEFDWFNMNFIAGWPSGHTANAFAAAATITAIYRDNLPIKIAAYSYAALIGFGVSVNVHWASDVLAGALIGYAVGKTVGHNFSQYLENQEKSKMSFYVTPNSAGVILRL
jgi:membrane-associated phospholipid phosphatase